MCVSGDQGEREREREKEREREEIGERREARFQTLESGNEPEVWERASRCYDVILSNKTLPHGDTRYTLSHTYIVL